MNGKETVKEKAIEAEINEAEEPEKAQQEPAPEDNSAKQEPEPKTPETEVKKSFIDKQYEKYCDRRKKRAEKKANKKPLTKAEKVGIAAGGTAVAGALLAAGFKAFLNHYSDDDTVELDDDDVRELGSAENLEIPESASTAEEE